MLKKHDRTTIAPVQTKSRMSFTVHPVLHDEVIPWRGYRPNQWTITPQDKQLLALRDWYPTTDTENLRVVCEDCVDASLEKTKLFGPFDLDTVRWLTSMACKGMHVVFARTSDGKEYVEF